MDIQGDVMDSTTLTNNLRNMANYNLAGNSPKTIFESSYSRDISEDINDSSVKRSDLNNYLDRISDNLNITSDTSDINDIVAKHSLNSQIQQQASLVSNYNEGIEMIQIMQDHITAQQGILGEIADKSTTLAELQSDTSEYHSVQKEINTLLDSYDSMAMSANYNGIPLLSKNSELEFGDDVSTNSDVTTSDVLGHLYGYKSANITSSGSVDLVFSNGESENDIRSFELSSTSTGIKDLAELINSNSDSLGGLEASWEVKSTADSSVSEGTVENLVINGIEIGDVAVQGRDLNSNLVDTINSYTDQTGVTASTDDDGVLTLESDGRGIEVSADTDNMNMSQLNNYGSLTLTKSSESSMSFYDKNSLLSGDGATFALSLATLGSDIELSNDDITLSDDEISALRAKSIALASKQLDTMYDDLEADKESFRAQNDYLTSEMVKETIGVDTIEEELEATEFDKAKLISEVSEYAFFEDIDNLKNLSIQVLLNTNTDMIPEETKEEEEQVDTTTAIDYSDESTKESQDFFSQDYFNESSSTLRSASTYDNSSSSSNSTSSSSVGSKSSSSSSSKSE
jgi:flagellin